MMRRFTSAVAGVALTAAAATTVFAADRYGPRYGGAPYAREGVIVGTLECLSPGTVSLIVSLNQYDCQFFSRTGRSHQYIGQVARIGVEAGVTTGERLVWHVYAPTSAINGDGLRGRYGGGHAGIGVVLGVGVNVLYGGSDRTISLQPVSYETTQGVNVALSVAGLTLN